MSALRLALVFIMGFLTANSAARVYMYGQKIDKLKDELAFADGLNGGLIEQMQERDSAWTTAALEMAFDYESVIDALKGALNGRGGDGDARRKAYLN